MLKMLITGDLGVREMSQSKISIIELFAGIGAQVAALKRLGVDYKTVGISEIDKYAIQSYEAINGPTFNYGDITKIPMLDYADLWTYSFPCQDLSVAGKQAGIAEGTRSGLLLHVERLLETAVLLGNQPKYLLLENVKALVSKKFKPDFERWLAKLESLGYNNYWQVLNAKDYGVPQNRERVFVVSIRKDVDTKGYKFPEKIPLTRRLKDVLEPVVDEKYYLAQEKVDKLLLINMDKEVSNTIRCGGGSLDGKHTWDIVACASRGKNPENPSDRTAGAPTEQRLEVNQTGCSNTLTSVQKDNYLLEPQVVGGIGEKSFGKQYRQGNRIYSSDAISPALVANNGNASGGSVLINEPLLVREPQVLTPKRNEYGKLVRKEYEAGNFTDSRHNMTDMQPRADGVSNTLTTVNKDNYLLEPLHIKEATQKGFADAYEGDSVSLDQPNSTTRRGRVGNQISNTLTCSCNTGVVQLGNIVSTGNWDNPQAGRVYSTDGISPTLNTMQGGQREPKILKNYRIRKLTPLECWRLMDFTDEEFYAAQLSGISNSQLYKQAGNSIVVAVLQAIFKELLA